MTDEIRDIIDDVLDRFDANQVHSIMKMMKWSWAHTVSETGIPEVYEIRQEARRLLNAAYNNESGYCASGGLVATYKFDMVDGIDVGHHYFSIIFAAVNSETW